MEASSGAPPLERCLISLVLKPPFEHVRILVFTFADLFCGIGGIRLGLERAGASCVWANDVDASAGKTYTENFGRAEFVLGDISTISSSTIPHADVLCGGFPCQPFSIAGVSKYNSMGKPHGLEDGVRGTLFFQIARLVGDNQPQAFLLENVKNLLHHDGGRTFATITKVLEEDLGYSIFYATVNAKIVLPQNRERIYIVGFLDRTLDFEFPQFPLLYPPVSSILEREVSAKYTLSDRMWDYLKSYASKHKEAGHGFGYGLVDVAGITRTLSARYYKDGSEILIPQLDKNPRRLTPRECARLQGFPDTFKIPVSDTAAYKQFGNSVAVPVIEILSKAVLRTLSERPKRGSIQARLTSFVEDSRPASSKCDI